MRTEPGTPFPPSPPDGAALRQTPSPSKADSFPRGAEGPYQAITPWEAAYLAFETPAQEIRKFRRRLHRLGAPTWPRHLEVVELFCGRGNGLHALEALGFERLEGIDLSPALAAQYRGPARIHVGDCRRLPFADHSKDVLIVQGGLHHLEVLPDDLERTLAETRRVLRPGGRFVAVEPWLTPFLVGVHLLCGWRLLRRLSRKIDALAVMTEHELRTYLQWLGQPRRIRQMLQAGFREEIAITRWGKLMFLGRA